MYFAWIFGSWVFFLICHLHCKMIHLIVTPNIQLCTCTFLFPLQNKAISSSWMKFPCTWGPQQGWTSTVFLTPAPLGGTFPQWQGFPFIPTCFFGGKLLNPVLLKGDHGMDHAMVSAAKPCWSTSADTTWIEWLLHELQMKCARPNYPWRCFGSTSSSKLCFWDVLGSNHRKHPVHLQEHEQGQCHHSPATFRDTTKI